MNRLTAVGGEEGEGEGWEEGEGISQRTGMNDSWTWTMERGLTVVKRGELGGGGQKREKKKLEQL